MTNFITITTLLCVIAGIWEFKYNSLPVWIFLSIVIMFGAVIIFTHFINYIMERFKYGKFIVGTLWIMPLIYSIVVPFMLSFQILTKKFIFKLPSVGWALFFFSIYSLALSLRKSKEGFNLAIEKKWLKKLENIEAPFKSNSLQAFGIAIIIALIIIFICVCEMEYDYRMFFGCIPLILISIIFGSSLKNEKRQFMAVFILLIIEAGKWIMVSYESYYSGVERRLKNEAKVSYNSTVNILNSSLPEDRKLKEIHNVHKSSDAEIRITKASEGMTYDFYVKKSSPGRAEEYILSNFSNHFPLITYDRDVFKYDFSYYNRPLLDIGLARAISFSTFPDYVKAIMKNKFAVGDNLFLERRNYQRSTNFWVAFWLLYMFTILVMYYKQTRDEVIKEKDKANQKQKEAFEELEDYKIMFDNMRKQIDDQISDDRNTLQLVDSSWSKIAHEANQSVLYAYQSKRHDVFNYLTGKLKEWGKEDYLKVIDTPEYKKKLEKYLLDIDYIDNNYYEKREGSHVFLKETYDVILNPWLERIRVDLQDLDKIFVLTPDNFTVEEIVKEITDEKTIKDIDCHVNVDKKFNGKALCRVIPDKLRSMVYNLLENSAQAGARYRDRLRSIDRSLSRKFKMDINLNISEVTHKKQKYLSVEVVDNCGGFPPEIMDTIYSEKVRSSKTVNQEHGYGTYLIGRFARIMGIVIQHDTVLLSNNQKGAKTTLLIPYISETE